MKPYVTKIRVGIYFRGNRNYRCTIPKKLFGNTPLERDIIFWLNKKNQIVISPSSKDFKQINGIFIHSHLQSNGHSYYVIFPDRVLESYIRLNNLKSGKRPHLIENKDSFKIISKNEDFVLF